ncbi:MAG: ABC transporter ATP-binding protein [Alphaproteobacteria bacterium]
MKGAAKKRDRAAAALELRGITRVFEQGNARLEVLTGADLAVRPGEVVALIGPSGSGKSTLLHIAGLLERPTSGEVLLGGRACSKLNDRERTALRRDRLGFVYQFHQLLPEFTALENVVLPQLIAGLPRAQADAEARRLLDSVGLSERLTHRPSQLSGGEQQRVAVARALANHPQVLLADEPTGNLDPRTAQMVFEKLIGVLRKEGRAALVATHNLQLATHMDRAVLLRGGKLIDGRELAREELDPATAML